MTSHLTLTPPIEALRQQFERLSSEVDALAAPLSDEEFAQQPPQGGWSVAQCLDHLNSTARAYLPMLDDGVADAIRRGLYGEAPNRYRLLVRLYIRSMEPPPRVRAKTPALFQPLPNRSRHDILAAFRAYQVQYIDRLRQANGLDLTRAKVTSPVASWLRIPLGAAFELMAAHERRHLWQAQQVITAIAHKD